MLLPTSLPPTPRRPHPPSLVTSLAPAEASRIQPCTPSAKSRAESNASVRLRIVPGASDPGDETAHCASPAYHSQQKAMQRLGFATVVWGCIMIVASLMLLVRTNTPLTAIGGVVGVNWGAGGSGRRHEIHVPAHRHLMERMAVPEPVDARIAVMYTVYGAWHEETEWDFLRLVNHVLRSEALASHDVVLVWETADSVNLPVHTPMTSAAVTQVLQEHPNRVQLFHTTTDAASKLMPASAFSKGFYFNPEVAVLQFLNPMVADLAAQPGATKGGHLQPSLRPYDYVWLLESDVRWTGDWERLLLTPYASNQGKADLFAFKTAQPWVYNAPGWETSNCFEPLANYPTGWRARGENSTNLPVEWSRRRSCFMPSKRMSYSLLEHLNDTYMAGVGGYNEVAVPTINAMFEGSFGTASPSCMHYSYKNSEASALYDAYRRRGLDVDEAAHRSPCLLHPVKSSRTVKQY